jgi:phosphatidylserine decarboxylase
MVKDAFYLLIPLLALFTLFLLLGWTVPALAMIALAAFVAFFFRDPNRIVTVDPDAIVSPADGKVVQILPASDGTVVSIFLSVFDVHVNRAPVAGEISAMDYKPGKFLLAFDERASVENAQLQITIKGEREVSFNLIAGLVARRIVPWKELGEIVDQGDRIGLIRFGSRADILIPRGCRLVVRKGDRVSGGTSPLAYWGAGD